MSSWLAPIKRILEAETDDLRRLAELVGAKPEIFYVGRDLSRCDLRGQDLRGMNFTGAVLNPDLMDDATKVDPEFDPRFVFKGEYIQIRLRQELLALALAYGEKASYAYRAWAIKNLIESGAHVLISPQNIRGFIMKYPRFEELLVYRPHQMKRITIQVYPYLQQMIHDWKSSIGEKVDKDTYAEVILAGLIRTRLRDLRKDYSELNPMAMFDKTGVHLKKIQAGMRF